MKTFLRKHLMWAVRWYWKIFKPKTFGVKVLIGHPKQQQNFLLVRHSYGDQTLWNIPGGGYNPKKESPLQAANREVYEELSLKLINPKVVGSYCTSVEGKNDTVVIIDAMAQHENLQPRDEVLEVKWATSKEILVDVDTAKIAKYAVKLVQHSI